MRPHRLRVQAFGAFADTEQVSFDDLDGLFLLHGETGAGKTTLLDAIAFALYGRVPGERGTARRLRSDHAAPDMPTEVQFEATISGRQLRITRRPEQERPKKSGAGLTREQASVRVEELAAGGAWEAKSVRVGEADKEISDLMGMSAEQFFQVVLLPQGQFAQFLHAKAQEKEALLQKLFGTDRFRMVEDWLAARRRATADEVTKAAETVDRLVAQVAQAAGVPVPDESPDAIAAAPWAAGLAADATAARDNAAAVFAARKSDLDAALAAKTAAGLLADRQRRRGDALRRQRELAAAAPAVAALRAESDAAARSAEVAAILAEADRATTAAQSARDAEAQARAAIPADSVARDAASGALRTAEVAERAQFGRLDGLRSVARQAAEEDHHAAAASARAGLLAVAHAEAEAAAVGRQAARPQAVQARDAASAAAADLPGVQAAAGTARRVAVDLAAVVAERAKRDRLHEAHLAAREKSLTVRADALRIREARIDGMRAELAATMTDGSPCPVCGSLDHPDPVEPTFEPVSRDEEDAADRAADNAAGEADEIGQNMAAAGARIDELAKHLDEAGFGGADDALTADPATLAAAARQAEADQKHLETEAARVKAAADQLTAVQANLDALDAAIAADESRLVELTQQRTAALAEANAAALRAAGWREELRAQLGDAPDLDTALAATRRMADALAVAADAADETVRAVSEARAAGERAILAAIDASFGPSAAGGGGRHPSVSEEAGAAAVEAARKASRDARWRKDADDRIKRHETEAEAVAQLLADPDLDVPLDPAAPVAETTAAATEAQQAYDESNKAHATAQHTVGQLARLKPRLDGALADLRPLKDRADQVRQLADLAAGVGTANQYRMTLSSFVLAARLEEVAAAASERLRTMTAGRYSLVHSDARKGGGKAGLSLLACDAWTGIDRDTATLSGGETFLASLALALGLADVVTAESAGTPMEALFVDEGFGTLDEDTLDEVMNVLDGLREGGRIVGIVSHVTELRHRIPSRVHVRKGRHGSRVEIAVG
jgi:exonuclease SbcC